MKRVRAALFQALALAVLLNVPTLKKVDAFILPFSASSLAARPVVSRPIPSTASHSSSVDDCGSGDATIFSGDPPQLAKEMDIRERIRAESFLRVNGEAVRMDDLIGSPNSEHSQRSIVVCLRSLG